MLLPDADGSANDCVSSAQADVKNDVLSARNEVKLSLELIDPVYRLIMQPPTIPQADDQSRLQSPGECDQAEEEAALPPSQSASNVKPSTVSRPRCVTKGRLDQDGRPLAHAKRSEFAPASSLLGAVYPMVGGDEPGPSSSEIPYSVSSRVDENGQQKTGQEVSKHYGMGRAGRRKFNGPTEATERLHWLFTEMLQEQTEDGLKRFPTQTALAEYLQMGKQYVSQVVNINTSGVGDITAGTIKYLMRRMGILPDWFFDEWAEDEPRPSYKDYLASTKRIARSVQALQRDRVVDRQTLEDVLARLAELEAERGLNTTSVTKRKRNR